MAIRLRHRSKLTKENKPTYRFLFRGEKREIFMDAVMEFSKYTNVLGAELLE